MQKTTADMGKYLKVLLPLDLPNVYSFKPMFKGVATQDNLKNGIGSFKDFLGQVFDHLITDNTVSTELQKGKNFFPTRQLWQSNFHFQTTSGVS